MTILIQNFNIVELEITTYALQMIGCAEVAMVFPSLLAYVGFCWYLRDPGNAWNTFRYLVVVGTDPVRRIWQRNRTSLSFSLFPSTVPLSGHVQVWKPVYIHPKFHPSSVQSKTHTWTIHSGRWTNPLKRIWPGGAQLIYHVAWSQLSDFCRPNKPLLNSDFDQLQVQIDRFDETNPSVITA